MLWIEIGLALIVAFVVLGVVLTKRPVDELGSVSAHWVAEHRAER